MSSKQHCWYVDEKKRAPSRFRTSLKKLIGYLPKTKSCCCGAPCNLACQSVAPRTDIIASARLCSFAHWRCSASIRRDRASGDGRCPRRVMSSVYRSSASPTLMDRCASCFW
ncbi:hypothetical protein ABW21_db0203259 [Orbilia brochopaga]|nr:hypothetical protein ABW21_db0203259 [Drechslerella brochopaga]